ncbi:hypothetical protein EON66_03315 [archaeon]|nr:MAG: hypothetical protein EON66_03315 [archaeon]
MYATCLQGDHGFKADFSQLFRVVNILKGVWAIGWAGALIALAESKSFLGTDLFGGPIWFIVIGARLVCILISEGIFSTCGCSRTNKVRRFFMEMEHIYMLSNDGGKDAVLGWKYMKQPFSRVWKYTRTWLRARTRVCTQQQCSHPSRHCLLCAGFVQCSGLCCWSQRLCLTCTSSRSKCASCPLCATSRCRLWYVAA